MKDQAVNKLNKLLTRNYDAEQGYISASENVDHRELNSYFRNAAAKRYEWGKQLKSEIQNLGGEPERGTSFEGDAHRAWMDLKSNFTTNDSKQMLDEVVRGEETALNNYEEVINSSELPLQTKQIIQNQRQELSQLLQNAKSLQSSFSS